MLKLGMRYSRTQIHKLLGGEVVSYLPRHRGQIVCVCVWPRTNPRAPREVLPGGADDVRMRAKQLEQQGGVFPFFLGRKASQWEYVGDFRYVGTIQDRAICDQRGQEAVPSRADVSMVLQFEPTKSPTE